MLGQRIQAIVALRRLSLDQVDGREQALELIAGHAAGGIPVGDHEGCGLLGIGDVDQLTFEQVDAIEWFAAHVGGDEHLAGEARIGGGLQIDVHVAEQKRREGIAAGRRPGFKRLAEHLGCDAHAAAHVAHRRCAAGPDRLAARLDLAGERRVLAWQRDAEDTVIPPDQTVQPIAQ